MTAFLAALVFAAMEAGELDIAEDTSETSACEAPERGPVEFAGRDVCVATMARDAVVRAGSAFLGVAAPAPVVADDAAVLMSDGRVCGGVGLRAGISAAAMLASGVAGC